MLLSKDAISDVIEVIHEAILDLYSRGEPADAITVANELTRRTEIARVGGAPYLHTLISSVPTAANAGYYARIVRERAILRRLVEAGTRIVQFGYAGEADADDLVAGPRPKCSRSPTAGPVRTTTRYPRSCPVRWTRSRRSAAAAASSPACPLASPTSTPSPTACT